MSFSLDEQTAQLCEVFPDVSPAHLRKILHSMIASNPGQDPLPLAMDHILANGLSRQNSASSVEVSPVRPSPAAVPVGSRDSRDVIDLVDPSSPKPARSAGQKRKPADDDDDILAPLGIVLPPPKAPRKDPALVTLSHLFPDCLASHIAEQLAAAAGDADAKLQLVSNILLERKYPRKPAVIELLGDDSSAKPHMEKTAILKKDWCVCCLSRLRSSSSASSYL